jgi:hypothetical protein
VAGECSTGNHELDDAVSRVLKPRPFPLAERRVVRPHTVHSQIIEAGSPPTPAQLLVALPQLVPLGSGGLGPGVDDRLLRSVPVTVAATPTQSPSSAEALALLLLAACGRQRQEIDRLAAERTALMEANQALVVERDELRQRNEELKRRLGLN